MSEETLEQFNELSEHDKKEVMNLIRYKNEYKYQQLQQRIDKAIEYINQRIEDINNGGNEHDYRNLKKLLEILEGDK